MSFMQMINLFSFYGIDTLLLALATTLVVQLLKNTLLSKIKRKMLTFLPFVIGTLFYAVYACFSHWDWLYGFENYVDVMENGFAIGTAATLLYVLYEQFIREDSSLSVTAGVIAALIEGYVPTDSVEKTAQEIAEAIAKDVLGDGAEKTADILKANANEGITERDVELLSKLIIEALAHMNTV